MLGVVRVYSRKVNYLFQDCSEALVKIKQAFTRDKDVDLAEGAETAPLNTITLPENYDDLELFFEPDGAASRDAAAANAEDITLDAEFAGPGGAFASASFEEQYAYDDRIHGDVDDDFIVDEMDPGFHPSAGYRTPGAPRYAATTNAGDVADVRLEDYDEAGADASAGDSGDGFGGDGEHDSPKGSPNGDETDIAPLPLDDDLEDENGVRGTVVGFKTPPVSANDKARGAKIAEGKENAPHTGSTVVLEWGKTAQKAARPEPAKRARSRARQTTMKLKFDAATILDRDAVSRAIRDASDITKTRAPGAVRKMADLADDDRPFGADEERDEAGHATLGYYRDAHGVAPPPETPAEARAAVRGALGGRDPLMGHRASRR